MVQRLDHTRVNTTVGRFRACLRLLLGIHLNQCAVAAHAKPEVTYASVMVRVLLCSHSMQEAVRSGRGSLAHRSLSHSVTRRHLVVAYYMAPARIYYGTTVTTGLPQYLSTPGLRKDTETAQQDT